MNRTPQKTVKFYSPETTEPTIVSVAAYGMNWKIRDLKGNGLTHGCEAVVPVSAIDNKRFFLPDDYPKPKRSKRKAKKVTVADESEAIT